METQQLLPQSILTKESFKLEDTKELENYFKDKHSLEFIRKLIDSKINFDLDSVGYMMEVNSARRDIDDPRVSTLNDVTQNRSSKNMITLVEDEKKLFVAGDLHADFISLQKILKKSGFYDDSQNTKILFLGDYVDRGSNRFNVINLLITLEFLLPDNILLLKGNHELYVKDEKGTIKSPMSGSDSDLYFFTFLNKLANHPEHSKSFPKSFIENYASYFDSLPLIAMMNLENIKIAAVHGGLPRPDMYKKDYYGEFESLNDFFVENAVDNIGISLKSGFMWSDPYDKAMEGFRNTSETRFKFNKEHFTAFCKKYDIDVMLRAHEALNNGYKTYFDNRLISVFSTGKKDIKGKRNENSYAGNVTPNILQVDMQSKSIKSFEILFDDNDMICEEEISFTNVLDVKQEQELNYKAHEPQENFFNSGQKSISKISSLLILDRFNPLKKTMIDVSESNILNVNYRTLRNLYGIHKDIDFTIDFDKLTITNNSTIVMQIDRFVLKKDDTMPFIDGEVKFQSGAILKFESFQ